ncbi:MAG: tetratricopeptide repeat protein [Thermoanaerobaculia bacterium]
MSNKTIWMWVAAVGAGSSGLPAQVPTPEAQVASPETSESENRETKKAARPGSPYEAYEAGFFDDALKGFVDLQVERPDDPEVALNVGSTHYQMRNFPEADRTFTQAVMAQDPDVRGQALYNLGNSAYRQGRLPESVELYKAALEINPDDEDAKFNLEFVRDEIRRRHEEAQKRQQEQEQQDQQQQNEQQDSSQESGQEEQESQPESEEGQQGDQEGQQEQQPESAQDRDQDGLSDSQEQSAENPTDPDDADSDDDGLPDGAEDFNRNGRVDPEETDPNRMDTDGDGVPDSQEAQGGETGSAEPESLEGLTPEEAERYLQALQEGRPNRKHPGRGRRVKGDKDW